MATDKKPPGKKSTSKKSADKPAAKKPAKTEIPKSIATENPVDMSDKPIEVSLEAVDLDFEISAIPSSLSHDTTMEIDWEKFETTTSASDSPDKPEEGPEPKQSAINKKDDTPTTIESNSPTSDDGWEDILSQAFGVSESKETPTAFDIDPVLPEATDTVTETATFNTSRSMDTWMQELMGVTSLDNTVTSTPESPINNINEILLSEKTDAAIAPVATDSFLESLLEEAFPDIKEAPAPLESAPVVMETPIIEPPAACLVSDNATVFIDEETPENIPSFETQLDTISLHVDDTINNELIQTNRFTFMDKLSNDTATIVPLETSKPDAIECVVLDSGIIISDEPLPITQQASPYDSDPLDTLNVTDNFTPTDEAHFDNTVEESNEPVQTIETLTLRMDDAENHPSIRQTENGYAIYAYPIADAVTTTPDVDVHEKIITVEASKETSRHISIEAEAPLPVNFDTEITTELFIEPETITTNTIEITAEIIANHSEDAPALEPSEPVKFDANAQDLQLETVVPEIHVIADEIETTIEPSEDYPKADWLFDVTVPVDTVISEPVTETFTDSAMYAMQEQSNVEAETYSDTVFFNEPILDIQSDFLQQAHPINETKQPEPEPDTTNIINAHVRFIPVKNAHQDWVFSVVNFGTPTEQTFFMERPSAETTPPVSDVPNMQDLFNDFAFDFTETLSETFEQLDEQETHPEIKIQYNEPKPAPDIEPAFNIQLDTHFDDTLDFDFSDLSMPANNETFEMPAESLIPPEHNQLDEPSLEQTAPVIEPYSPNLAIKPKANSGHQKTTPYRIGGNVQHPVYGHGSIQKVIHAPRENVILQIEFKTHGMRLIDPTLTQLKHLNKVSV